MFSVGFNEGTEATLGERLFHAHAA